MKFICTSDWHIRANCPKNRIDNYKETLFKKLEWILNQEPNSILLVAGDIFDSPFVSYSLTLDTIKLLRKKNRILYVVEGQHDLRYRTSKENTPLAILNEMENVNIVRKIKEPPHKDICIYGVSFGEEIPKPEDKNKFNILLIHKMIVNENPLWETQEDYTKASSLLKQYNYDLIVSGDNHAFFISEHKGKMLINCGSLMRSTIAQKDHIPKIVLYDTETRKYKVISVPIRPIEEVMNLEAVETEKQTDEKLSAFVRGLSEYRETGLDFMRNLDKRIKEDNITEDIKNLILECAEEG